MQWIDLIEMAKSGVVENISDTTNDFFKLYPLKLYVSSIQTNVSKMIACMQGTYTFTTTASTELYDTPADFVKLQAARYNDKCFLTETTKKPWVAPDTNSKPYSIFVQGNSLGLFPIPSESDVEVDLWYWKRTSPYALRLKDLSYTDVTEISIGIEESVLTFVITGGVAADTYTFDLTAEANDTIAELITAINAESGLKDCVKATKCNSLLGTDLSTTLEEFDASSMFGKNVCIFKEPEIPEEMQTSLLLPAMLSKLKIDDREAKIAAMYNSQYKEAFAEEYIRYKERFSGSRNMIIGKGQINIANKISDTTWVTV